MNFHFQPTFPYQHIKALLIDIDDTITRPYNGGGGLFGVLQSAGEQLGGLSPDETAHRIAQVKYELKWWHWSDYIVALELNPKQFWDYAYEVESRYLEPTGPEILGALKRLKNAGILLYIASNNPSSGILHKLRLAGVAHNNGSDLFGQLLGCTELHAMKWEPIYWRKVLAHTALDADEVAVVGDNPRDDYAVPRQVGIAHSFLIDRESDRSAQNSHSLTYARDFDDIADCLLNARAQENGHRLNGHVNGHGLGAASLE